MFTATRLKNFSRFSSFSQRGLAGIMRRRLGVPFSTAVRFRSGQELLHLGDSPL